MTRCSSSSTKLDRHITQERPYKQKSKDETEWRNQLFTYNNLHSMTMKVKHCLCDCIVGLCYNDKTHSRTLFSHYFSSNTASVWLSAPKQTPDQSPQQVPLRSDGECCAFWVAASALACNILTARRGRPCQMPNNSLSPDTGILPLAPIFSCPKIKPNQPNFPHNT